MPNFTFADAEELRVAEHFSLAEVDPKSTPGFSGSKTDAVNDWNNHDEEIAELQERMFAHARMGEQAPSVLLILQGMDTAGKGGVIRHVIGGVDPQGVRLASFKKPTEEEQRHDFLWRIEKELPPGGYIGVFDRSHYEDVLVGRVRKLAPAEEIERRYEAILDFEDAVQRSNTKIVKVMLHISRHEQYRRLSQRLARPDKHWKFNPGDVDERQLWDRYQEAYDIALQRTSSVAVPWYCVPADNKWYSRMVVKGLLLEALRGFKLQWPEATFDVDEQKKRLAATNGDTDDDTPIED